MNSTCQAEKPYRGSVDVTIFYSLIESAKLHDVDPAQYPTIAARAEARGELVMPWQWVPLSENSVETAQAVGVDTG